MAAPRARLTTRQARRVGLELGGLLLVVAGVLLRRGTRPALALAAGALGAALCALAAFRPAALQPLASRWMGQAARISRVTSPIVFAVIYLLVFTPMAWLRRTVGHSPIARDPAAETYWHRRDTPPDDAVRQGMEHQF